MLGKGPADGSSEHGTGYLRLLPPHTVTDNRATDYDGVVTDPRFQPVVLPDGTTLIPARVPADAEWHKIPDAATGVVAASGAITVNRSVLGGAHGPARMTEYTGGQDITPETAAMRRRAQEEASERRARIEQELRNNPMTAAGFIAPGCGH